MTDAQQRIDSLIDAWSGDPRVVHVERLPGRPARLAETRTPLHPLVASRLAGRPLWSHQARAIDLARSGRSVAVATSTSSGKSLCYQIPAIESALEHRRSTLMLFPTKALARDQLRSFVEWDIPGVVAAAYDADCTPAERAWARDNADVLLTNPEMLHQSILANHRRWAAFLNRLELVVLDELHVLRGVFGSHAAQVLRRLRRLAATYGRSPRFVFTSATIGDPGRLASQLCGLDVRTITHDGSPSGPRTIVLWNPRVATPSARPLDADAHAAAHGERRVRRRPSVHGEAAGIAADLVTAGMQTLVFCRSRRTSELVAEEIRRRVDQTAPGAAGYDERIRSYRAGHLPEERREVEAALSDGRLSCVVATTALELGIDVGGLDAVVLDGYPGTISSFRQQVGRSGRGRRPSLAVLVAGHDQLDQWMARHPSQLTGRQPEPAVVNLDNPNVFVPHLACAAQEHPLGEEDRALWPDQLDEGVRRLVLSDRASVRRRRGERVAVWTGRGAPAPTIRLRSACAGTVRILDVGEHLIGTVEAARAAAAVHPGAVYLHQGRAWMVVELDLDRGIAVVEPTDGGTYTLTRAATSIRILDVSATGHVGGAELRLGTVEVTNQVLGFQTRSVDTHEILGRAELDLAPTQVVTRAVWYRFPPDLVDRAGVAGRELHGALHAVEHAAIAILPLFTICDRSDVRGTSTAWSEDADGPTVVIHDSQGGGAGIAELAFGAAEQHMAVTLQVIDECSCDHGCPSCVQSPSCGYGNDPLDKDGARRLLRSMLHDHAGASDRTAS